MKEFVFDLQRFDRFENWDNNATVTGTAGDDTVYNSFGSNVKVFVSTGNDTVYSGDSYGKNICENAYVDLGDGNDYVSNVGTGNGSTLIGGAGNDTLYNNSNQHVLILGGGDSESIVNYWSDYTTIYGGEGGDRIELGGYSDYRCSYDYADGGAGNDTITSDSKYETIIGGAGDDYITLTGYAYQHYIVYSEGDGNDTVGGFAADHTLVLNTENYSKTESDGNVIITVGDGSITFLNRNASEVSNIVVNPDVTNISKNGVDYTPQSGGDTSTTTTGGDTSTTTTTTYEGGNTTVTNYSGEKINYSSDFTGIGFNNDDFIVSSSSGNLTIQNVRDKIIDISVSFVTVAYVYMASSGGNLDGSSFSQLEVILGGNNSSNTISAGSGGSSLWGGFGGSDTLIGGSGYDEFFYVSGDGNDVFQNVGENDAVNLFGVSLEQISFAEITSNGVNARFFDGGSLTVSGRAGSFILGGQVFHADYQSKTWS